MADGPFWQYIPDLDWALVRKYMGSSPLYEHLVDSSTEDGAAHTSNAGKSMLDTVLELLDVESSEFCSDVPFTAYGLDSLSAARLSFALHPFVAVSQLQLLSDISLNDLHARIEKSQQQSGEDVAGAPSPQQNDTKNEGSEMEKLIAKYTNAFPKHTSSGMLSADEVVLITGTTGAIGTSMLAQLAEVSSVARIYAFNRTSSHDSSTLRERQAASLKGRGYDAKILDRGTIVLVEGDQSKYDLGISSHLYEEV